MARKLRTENGRAEFLVGGAKGDEDWSMRIIGHFGSHTEVGKATSIAGPNFPTGSWDLSPRNLHWRSRGLQLRCD